MAEKKQLVLVVEGTVDLGSHWRTIFSDYLQKVIRKFCGNEDMEAASSIVELALVQFNAHGSNSTCLVQRSCWTRNVDHFFEWLSCMHFSGGGFCDAAIAEGLAEVLMMCPPPNGTETQPTEALQRHCILVAASNPCPLPMVYWPPNESEMQSVSHLSDAETVAKSFPQFCVSLSVICPKQVPRLKAIYNAGKRNPSATAPTIDVIKNPNYLILISEDFLEACVALSPSVRTSSSNQSPSDMKFTLFSPFSEPPPTSFLSVSGGNISFATVKVEPCILSPMASSQAVKTYSPLSTSQELISSTGMSQQVQGMQSVGVNNNMGTNIGLSQQTSSAPQSRQRKYVKIWEGKLDGIRHGRSIMITRLEAYRRSSSAESLAEDWPSTLLIDRLISVDYMHNKPYAGKCEFIVFRALQQHGFLGQMLEKKFCAVIQLPSQTLFLSPSPDKSVRLTGVLLPQDMVVFKPHIPRQQPSQEQQRVGPGMSQGAGGLTHLVGVGQGQVSSLEPKPELP